MNKKRSFVLERGMGFQKAHITKKIISPQHSGSDGYGPRGVMVSFFPIAMLESSQKRAPATQYSFRPQLRAWVTLPSRGKRALMAVLFASAVSLQDLKLLDQNHTNTIGKGKS